MVVSVAIWLMHRDYMFTLNHFDSHWSLTSSWCIHFTMSSQPQLISYPKVLSKSISEKLDGADVFRLVFMVLGSPKRDVPLWHDELNCWIEVFFFWNTTSECDGVSPALTLRQKHRFCETHHCQTSFKKTIQIGDWQHDTTCFPTINWLTFNIIQFNELSGLWLERKTQLFFLSPA